MKRGEKKLSYKNVCESYLRNRVASVGMVELQGKRILDTNVAFRRFLNLPDTSVSKDIDFYLSQESQIVMERALDSGSDEPFSLMFIGSGEGRFQMRSTLYRLESSCILFCERDATAESTTLSQMTLLNNELANLSRDFKRKNVALGESEKNLARLLEEKELLMQELNHRVGNNLNMIASILELQMHSIEDETLSNILKECRGRIHAIGHIHKSLFRLDFIGKIEIAGFLSSLSESILKTYERHSGRIRLHTSLEKCQFDTKSSVSLGLVVNELVTNSLKHGFPDGRAGEITLSSTKETGGWYTLVVRDNGVGSGNKIEPQESGSLGLKIVQSLVRGLGGEVQFEGREGFRVWISVPCVT